jgi:hypothetical protein
MALERTPENIHAATVIRLQTVYTALQQAIPLLEKAVAAATPANRDDALETLANARAALAVADGRSTDIPDGLRRSRVLADEHQTRRFLEMSMRGD